MKLRQTDLEFSYHGGEFRGTMPEAYERLLLLLCLKGTPADSARADEVEAAWTICDPILQEWERSDQRPLFVYEPGLWGPEECTGWMCGQGAGVVRYVPGAVTGVGPKTRNKGWNGSICR